ncbi:MAG: Gfo/Idh/MocA family oxidoreductase [Candidatus Omnitrophica bacterium]|nr:Gfo/Idh/MocA family oxidoreductase [Candidatus Omnitrophota bacterium]
MKVLQIGLGSMGKRRIRNMQTLGIRDIIGFDYRDDRRVEAQERYGIVAVDKLTPALLKERDIYIISTPPDKHNECITLALKYCKHAFVEASVISTGLRDFERRAKAQGVRIMPSCTFRFHPAVKRIKNIVDSGEFGKICNFSYHMGQYLPDWHPWESIKSFYVSKRLTSAAREMVPFELTWMVDIMGMPRSVFAFKGRNHDMGVDIDDTYAITLNFKGFQGTLLVDVVSRFATRSFILNLEKAQIRWNWEDGAVKLYDVSRKQWQIFKNPEGRRVKGYNPNIIEDMYVDEMDLFFKALRTRRPFPNTLKEDAAVLGILEVCEGSGPGKTIKKQG